MIKYIYKNSMKTFLKVLGVLSASFILNAKAFYQEQLDRDLQTNFKTINSLDLEISFNDSVQTNLDVGSMCEKTINDENQQLKTL